MREGYAIINRSATFALPDLYLSNDPLYATPRPREARLFKTWRQAVAYRATMNEMWQCSAQVVYLTEYDTQRPN